QAAGIAESRPAEVESDGGGAGNEIGLMDEARRVGLGEYLFGTRRSTKSSRADIYQEPSDGVAQCQFLMKEVVHGGEMRGTEVPSEVGLIVPGGIRALAEEPDGPSVLITRIGPQLKMAVQQIVKIERGRSAVPFAGRSGDVDVGSQMVCEEILTGVL